MKDSEDEKKKKNTRKQINKRKALKALLPHLAFPVPISVFPWIRGVSDSPVLLSNC